jgi:hypothetical protein
MMNGENENETTFRLLFYPPLVEGTFDYFELRLFTILTLILDDDRCEMVHGTCKYELQKCARDELDLSLPKDAETMEPLETVTRCGAHCDYGMRIEWHS